MIQSRDKCRSRYQLPFRGTPYLNDVTVPRTMYPPIMPGMAQQMEEAVAMGTPQYNLGAAGGVQQLGDVLRVCPAGAGRFAGGADPYVVPQPCYNINMRNGMITASSEQYGMLEGPPIVPSLAPDSPLNRIFTRGPVGPWEKVGYVFRGPARPKGGQGCNCGQHPCQCQNRRHDSRTSRSSSSRSSHSHSNSSRSTNTLIRRLTHENDDNVFEKTMPLFARKLDYRRNSYDYRVVDTNSVPIDVGHRVQWKMSGERVFVQGYGEYTIHIYDNFND